ncbi:hypothetical protein OnM2_063069 [Erysiphe neolycopersici]|uniref:Uncharacterized protein n=1 Tax=Erysiphe neolycopersici TaxID=212602 RepID=A0A420HNL4_9PEZI|nr:hypothetical protein OnM2_063069 [Erysiphe neolycopersici]
MILTKSNILSGSLEGAFERTKKAIDTIKQKEEIEQERIERMELEHFRSHYLKQWGRPLSAALAERDLGMTQSRFKDYNIRDNEKRNLKYRETEPMRHPLIPLQQQRVENVIQRQPAGSQAPQIQENSPLSNTSHCTRDRLDRIRAPVSN